MKATPRKIAIALLLAASAVAAPAFLRPKNN